MPGRHQECLSATADLCTDRLAVAPGLVSLRAAPRLQEGVAFTVDQTRGILTSVTETCPGRFHDEIEYVTVAGKFIKGAGVREPGAPVCCAQRFCRAASLRCLHAISSRARACASQALAAVHEAPAGLLCCAACMQMPKLAGVRKPGSAAYPHLQGCCAVLCCTACLRLHADACMQVSILAAAAHQRLQNYFAALPACTQGLWQPVSECPRAACMLVCSKQGPPARCH